MPRPTSGPQEDASQAVNVGVAAHITAAAPGGPRYEQAVTHEQRTAITNGLWLCQSCAKLVVNDPVQFTADILRGWKSTAEQEARDLVGKTAARDIEGHEISTAANARSRESTITRNLAIKKRLRKAFEDDRFAYGAQRFITLGLLRGRVVIIAQTEHDDEVHIISMREGTKREQTTYFSSLTY